MKSIDDFLTKNEYIEYLEERIDSDDLDEVLDNFSDSDVFDYLEDQGFDFLTKIDSQEIIEHLEMGGL